MRAILSEQEEIPEKKIPWRLRILFPVKTLWARDKTYILIFLVVNILAGQIGVLISLLIAWQDNGKIATVWSTNLSSAALFTFSISLVVSSLALVGSEFIDAFRFKKEVPFSEYKIVWGLLALAVLIIQAPLAGALLSKPAQPQVTEQLENQKEVIQSIKPTSKSLADSPCDKKIQSTQSSASNQCIETLSKGHQSLQVVFWILSMIISFVLFCLYRLPLISDKYAKERNKEVQDLNEKAASRTVTSFGESV